MTHKRLVVLGLAMALLLSVLAGPAIAVRTGTVDVKRASDMKVVGTSKLVRHHSTVTVDIKTTMLPSGAYTVWWVIFNNPQECSNDVCGEDDVFNDGDPKGGFNKEQIKAAQISLLWATGGIVGSDGTGQFRTFLTKGEAPGAVLIGDGLTHPKRAEVHVVIRSHGSPSRDVDELKAQLTTLNEGCPPNGCVNLQSAVHM